MLDINGGKNVDARVEQLIDILPALRVARAGRIAVRQLIHQDQRRVTGKRRVEIELLHHAAPVMNTLKGLDSQPLK